MNLGMPPDGRVLNHPAVIISNAEVYENDDCYIVVMLTSTAHNDIYSYVIEDHMFLKGNNTKPHSEARCHLITYILPSHIVGGKHFRLKKHYVDEIIDHISQSALYVL